MIDNIGGFGVSELIKQTPVKINGRTVFVVTP